VTLEDWRDAEPDLVQALYARERERWQRDLGWDTEASWQIVEAGRTLGHVPGWILRDADGSVLGWTFYVLHEGEVQIGGLTAERAVDLRRLLDRVLDSPEALLATSMSGFIFPAVPSLVSALARRRFAVRRSLYLSKPLAAGEPDPAAAPPAFRVRPFTDRDMIGAVRLLAGAYEGEPGAQCFAPRGRLDEWVRYVRQLIETPACGVFLREASLVAEETAGGRLVGLVLSTRLAAGTAHIAQLVVGQQARRQGLGDALLVGACAEATRAGATQMTLMVDEGNARARSLYARHLFTEKSAFAFGRRRVQVRHGVPFATPRPVAV
jgi:ribosomal protein S18 acetylase RimI-like enzyme